MSREQSAGCVVPAEPSFVVIKYGDDQEALINPSCSSYIFTDWIRQVVRADKDMLIDLVDLEGSLRHLPASTEDYATDYVTGRETYVVLRVERQGEDGPRRYISLLNNLDKSNPELSGKLIDLSRPGTRSARRGDKGGKKTPNNRNARNNQLKAENGSKNRPSSSERDKSRSRQGK